MDLVQQGSEHSIISELTSWQHGCRTGLFHYRLDIRGALRVRSLDLVAKIKPSDQDVLDVAETTAAICDPCVHRELTRFRDGVGIRGGHLRELEIYGLQEDRRFREHMPLCYGTWRDEENRSWGLLLERLDGMALMDAADDASAWTDGHIATAIDGMAELHAVWLGREDDLVTRGWIGHVPTSVSTTEMAPLWAALANHAAPMFATWAERVGANARAAREHDCGLVAGARGAPSDPDPQRFQRSQCRHPPHGRRRSSRGVRLGACDDRRAAARSR